MIDRVLRLFTWRLPGCGSQKDDHDRKLFVTESEIRLVEARQGELHRRLDILTSQQSNHSERD